VAGWTTEIDWSDVNKMVNAPTGLLLGSGGLAGCMRERLSTISSSDQSKLLDINAPNDLDTLRNNMVTCVDGIDQDLGYIQPGDNDYDWTNKSTIDRWAMAKMETELGPEPEAQSANSPVSAAWVKWWYDALNLLTRCMYPLDTAHFSVKQESALTFADAESAFNSAEWSGWSSNIPSSITAWHESVRTITYRIQRVRLRTNPSDRFSPYEYDNNYLVSAWGKIGARFVGRIYDNSDYPCSEHTFAEVFNDATVQQGEMDKDILVGDIDASTVGEPPQGEFQGWGLDYDSKRQICQFNISGGFKYVAP